MQKETLLKRNKILRITSYNMDFYCVFKDYLIKINVDVKD